jgi:hypothetical protein
VFYDDIVGQSLSHTRALVRELVSWVNEKARRRPSRGVPEINPSNQSIAPSHRSPTYLRSPLALRLRNLSTPLVQRVRVALRHDDARDVRGGDSQRAPSSVVGRTAGALQAAEIGAKRRRRRRRDALRREWHGVFRVCASVRASMDRVGGPSRFMTPIAALRVCTVKVKREGARARFMEPRVNPMNR